MKTWMIVVSAIVVVIVGLLGLAAYGITHMESTGLFDGPEFSPAKQHRMFCQAMTGPGRVALPAKVLAGSGQLSIRANDRATGYIGPALFSDRGIPVRLRADYHKVLDEIQRRQQPGATGRRNDAAVLKVNRAVSDCLSGH